MSDPLLQVVELARLNGELDEMFTKLEEVAAPSGGPTATALTALPLMVRWRVSWWLPGGEHLTLQGLGEEPPAWFWPLAGKGAR